MNTQAVLNFTPAQASREAAESITDKQRLYRVILAHLERVGSATCDECEEYLGMRHQTASARIVELRAKGLITPTGEKRKTRSGRNAVVYVVAEVNA
jgi:predicted ArsR family transcriptional regulator